MKIENNASNISSGQRQIIMLLRLFAFDYELILLDEAFENIDLKKTKLLGKMIKDFQKGLIIEVSHSKKFITNAKELNIEKFSEDSK
ncbi:MAG: hypothetical protein HRT99_02585 [Mycoplasmatales bacterium]|nr:hypothetical protein [Mycoplasmatales bacterium]